MKRSGIPPFGCLRPTFILVFVACAVGQTPAIPALSANDVSWLFPPPTKVADLDNLIAVRDLTAPNPQDATKLDPVWADAVFTQFIGIAGGLKAQVATTQSRVGLPADAQLIDAWYVAGVRIDAGAPGLSPEIVAQFGQSPEIRLIIQPITRNPNGTVTVNDVAGHLIFDFLTGVDTPAQAGCAPRRKPDLVEFKKIVAELAVLRTSLANGQLGQNKVTTSGPMAVHPGLVDPTTASNVRLEMKKFLERHISSARLNEMALMGTPSGSSAPWIFLAMLNFHPGDRPDLPSGGVVAVPGPTLDGTQIAQMLQPPAVAPAPHTNNLNPITCKNAAVPTANVPIANRNGLSTSTVFANPQASAANQQILALIADPTKSHFFNTDCISCHTETRRAMTVFQTQTFPGIDPSVLPPGDYTLRNFGWAAVDGPVRGIVTRRTAAETKAVIDFINSQILNK